MILNRPLQALLSSKCTSIYFWQFLELIWNENCQFERAYGPLCIRVTTDHFRSQSTLVTSISHHPLQHPLHGLTLVCHHVTQVTYNRFNEIAFSIFALRKLRLQVVMNIRKYSLNALQLIYNSNYETIKLQSTGVFL